MSHGAFLLSAFAWNLAHGMSWMALPLYAASQGLSHAEIGTMLSVPVLAQAPINLVGGAWSDRAGGRRILLGSSAALAITGLWLVGAQGFWMLMAAQLGFALSRAIFWPAAWAMASELPGDLGSHLGRLNAMTNSGQIAGNLACGVLLAAAGFGWTFAALAAAAALAVVAGLFTCAGRSGVPRRAPPPLLSSYAALLRQPVVRYAIICAYVSAVPFALAVSFYPLLLAHAGYAEGESGTLLALRALGAIAAALVASRFVPAGPRTPWPLWCGLVIALAVGMAPTGGTVATGFWLLLAGVGTGAMQLYFQMTICEASGPRVRASALALGGLGWNASLLITPFFMGLCADRFGLPSAFYLVAVLTLAVVAFMAVARERMRRPA